MNKIPKLVGAAGFEPATCSTQNCRATRLRYTPPVAACGYIVRPPPASRTARRARSLAFAEDRADDPVARLDAELARRPGDHFEHRAHRSAGRNEAIRFRLGALFDAHDPAVAANEDHIEGDVGIVHPERDRLVMLEVEQHALAFRQLLAEHQAAFAFRVIGRELDGEGVDPGSADDLNSILSGGLRLSE